MAPPNRTTPEQLEWLNSLKPQFFEHQKGKTLSDFWSTLDRDWFARWPEPGVAEAQCEPEGHPLREKATDSLSSRKSYLRNWFNNRSVNKRKAPIKAQPQSSSSRSHQPVEVYSRQFYKEKVQPLVTAELALNDIPKHKKLAVVKNFTKAAFDAEPKDVRDAIFAQAETLKAENAARRAEARKSEENLSPEGYATAIESVAYVLDTFIRDLAIRTGWAFSVMGGGPDPVNGGRIQTISFHEGRNFLGTTFKKAHVSFEESVLKPYVEFLNQVYPPAVCEARALPGSINGPPTTPPSEATTDSLDTAQDHNPVSLAISENLETPAASNAPTQTPHATANGSDTDRAPNVPSPVANAAQDMFSIDPQLLSAESPPSTATALFVFPSTHSFAPQAEIGSAVSALAAPLPSTSPPILPTHPASPILLPSAILASSPVTTTSTTLVHDLVVPLPSTLPSAPPALLAPVPSAILASSSVPTFPPALVPPPVINAVAAPALAKKASTKRKPRKRPGVRPTSALQKVAEKATAEKATAEKATAAEENTWSKVLTKAVKVVEARTAKAAAAKVARAAKAAETMAAKAAEAQAAANVASAAADVALAAADVASAETAEVANIQAVLQLGRSQRIRKAATSKEVVPLTDKRKRTDAKENDGCPKKPRTR